MEQSREYVEGGVDIWSGEVPDEKDAYDLHVTGNKFLRCNLKNLANHIVCNTNPTHPTTRIRLAEELIDDIMKDFVQRYAVDNTQQRVHKNQRVHWISPTWSHCMNKIATIVKEPVFHKYPLSTAMVLDGISYSHHFRQQTAEFQTLSYEDQISFYSFYPHTRSFYDKPSRATCLVWIKFDDSNLRNNAPTSIGLDKDYTYPFVIVE
jgi:hypothetical protein